MEKNFLCLTHIDGYRVRMRPDVIMEYGDLYSEEVSADGNGVMFSPSKIVGTYVNVSCHPGESTYFKETVEQIDEMLSRLGVQFIDPEAADEKGE